MNSSQAPWPLNKLQEAQRSREGLANRTDRGETPGKTTLDKLSIDRQNTKLVYSQDSDALENVGKLVDQQLENKSIRSDTDDKDEVVNANASTRLHDLRAETEPRRPFDIQDLDTQATAQSENINDKRGASGATKLFLTIGGITVLIVAGILAYENPMTTVDLQQESSTIQESLDSTPNSTEQTAPSIVVEPGAISLIETEIEETSTKLFDDRTESLAGDTVTIANSTDASSTRNVTTGLSKENVAPVNSSGDLNQNDQLLETQYESSSELQLETDMIALATKSDHVTPDSIGSQEIENLLHQAQSMFTKLQLTIPPGNNALTFYRKVLEIDPTNNGAEKGIERIKQKLLELGKRAKSKKQWQKAEKHFQRLIEIDPGGTPAEIAQSELNSIKSSRNL